MHVEARPSPQLSRYSAEKKFDFFQKSNFWTQARHARLAMLILWIGMVSLAACGTGFPRAEDAAQSVPPTSAAPPSPWAEAAAPYQGTVLHGITELSPPSLYVRDVLAPAFEAETGIRVEMEIASLPAIEQAIAAGDSRYDFAYVEQDAIYGFLEQTRLADLTHLFQANPDLAVDLFNLQDFTDFIDEFRDPASGHLYGVPIEAFIKVYAYRRDLFEDPVIAAAFAAQYNYPLAPAVTYQQYQDIAAFFTRYGQERGIPLWGTAMQAAVGSIASFYEFFETIAPSFGVYNWGINLETMRAREADGGQLDSRRAKAALSFWINLLQYAPPDATQSTWAEVAATFGQGRVAQAWLYGEYVAGLATDPVHSRVVGNVGVALPPTKSGVIEDATVGTGSIGYYDGAAFGIPVASDQQEAALIWLQYLGQSAIQPGWAVSSGRVVHLSTFDDPLVQRQDGKLDGYYSLMEQAGHLFSGAPPFPFHARLRDIIAPYIHQAITGELTPDEALEQAAQAADAELTRLGYPR